MFPCRQESERRRYNMKKTLRALTNAAASAAMVICSVVTAAAARDVDGNIIPKSRDAVTSGGATRTYFFFLENGKPNVGLIVALVVLAVLAVAAIVTAVMVIRSKKVRYMLRADSGPLKGQIFPIKEGTVKIGRNPDCDVRFPDGTKGVSRAHCSVTCTKGSLTILDLGSTSGTFINKKGQVSKSPMAIHVGQSFYLGEQVNMFTIIQK